MTQNEKMYMNVDTGSVDNYKGWDYENEEGEWVEGEFEVMKVENKWFVANDDGDIIGHDMTQKEAEILAQEMQEKDPASNWEALNGAE